MIKPNQKIKKHIADLTISKKKSNKIVAKNLKKEKTVSPKSISYQDYLIESLKTPEEAAGYLNAALEGGDINVFLLALQNVIQAQGGISALAEKTKKSRTSLYKTLSKDGNPYLKNANDLLGVMGMHLAVVPNEQRHSL